MTNLHVEKRLGKLTEVNLRDFWNDEARNFTPWLARDENISLLNETLGLEIEVIKSEKPIGDFNADILARDSQNNEIIIIENQLEKTDHVHLGQIITYAAGVDASIVIWIARKFREEHRQAIDWLNEVTTEDLGVFGIEIHLWQIDNSPPAP